MPARDLTAAPPIWRAAVWAACALLLLAAVLPALGLREAGRGLARLDPALLPGLLALSLANYALRALRWQLLCRAAGLRVPLHRNGLYYVAGFAFTVTPGRLGEAVRLWLLRHHHGVPCRRSVGVLLLDRVADAVPLLLLCLPGATAFAGHGWGVAAVAAVVLGGLALAVRPGWLAALARLGYAATRRRPRLFAGIARARHSLGMLASPGVLAAALALGLLGWSAEALGAWLVLHRLGAAVDLPAAAFVFGFGVLVGGLPLFPGGVGGTEGTMVGLLALLGVELGTAAAATAIVRLATLGFALALGLLALPMALRRPGRPRRHRFPGLESAAA
jgi:uncharacterized membrane protein YbhN (UPF0104 family)